jgi:hypothetical protein
MVLAAKNHFSKRDLLLLIATIQQDKLDCNNPDERITNWLS